MTKISISTGSVARYGDSTDDFIAGYKLLKACGFDAVDAGIDQLVPYAAIREKKVDPMWLTEGDDIDLTLFDPWKIGSEQSGVENYQAHAPFPTIDYDGDEEYSRLLINMQKKYIHGCAYIGCRHLVIHPVLKLMPNPATPDELEQMNIAFYSALIPTAKKYGVTICLENLFGTLRDKRYAGACSDLPAACRYVDRLNEMAGEKCFAFCLDVGHLLLASKDVKNAMLTLGSRIEAFHLHDNDGMNDRHVGPYMGILDWNRFMEGLKEIHCNVPLSFEVGVKWCDPELKPTTLKLIAEAGRMFARRGGMEE